MRCSYGRTNVAPRDEVANAPCAQPHRPCASCRGAYLPVDGATAELRPGTTWASAALAIVFGALTIGSGGWVLFGGDPARAQAGDYVLFVVWFNFIAGFAYVASGVGLARGRRWGAWLALGIAGSTLLVFAAFGAHVLAGGAYEARTIAALSFRTALWSALAWAGLRHPRRTT